MKYTGNYKLKKPEGSDVVNIEDLNDNADIIDAELKKLNDAIKDLDADGITLPDGKTISEKFEEIETEIGNIEELDTDTKSNIIAAINEIYQEIVAHKAEMATNAHLAKNIGLQSVNFEANNVEDGMNELKDEVDSKESPSGAQAKANAALNAAKQYADQRVNALAGQGNTKTVKQLDEELMSHKNETAQNHVHGLSPERVRAIYVSTDDPDDEIGEDGDIWIKYEE